MLFAKVILLYGPTSVLEAFATLELLTDTYQKKKLVLYGLCQGLITYVVRDTFSLFGPHVWLLPLSSIILMTVFLKAPILTAVLARALALLLVALGEMVVARPLLEYFGVNPTDTLSTVAGHIMMGWIGSSIIIILALYLYFVKPRRSAAVEGSNSA